jgi:hypothetical protein
LKILNFAMIITIGIFVATSVYAGPYTNDLSKCLVESTSQRDRTALAVWMFTAASFHPAVKPLSKVSQEQLDKANKTAGELFMKLLTKSCRKETQEALKYEGSGTMEASFKVLGEVAGRELFTSPKVNDSMSGLSKYMNEEELKSLIPQKNNEQH